MLVEAGAVQAIYLDGRHSGHFPLWDARVQTGQPWVGLVQPGELNPLNWILFSMPLSDGFIRFNFLNWYWVLIQLRQAAQIYRAYNLVRGVVVEAGGHQVVMRYRPTSVFIGMALAGLGVLLCAALQLSRDRKEAPPRTHS